MGYKWKEYMSFMETDFVPIMQKVMEDALSKRFGPPDSSARGPVTADQFVPIVQRSIEGALARRLGPIDKSGQSNMLADQLTPIMQKVVEGEFAKCLGTLGKTGYAMLHGTARLVDSDQDSSGAAPYDSLQTLASLPASPRPENPPATVRACMLDKAKGSST